MLCRCHKVGKVRGKVETSTNHSSSRVLLDRLQCKAENIGRFFFLSSLPTARTSSRYIYIPLSLLSLFHNRILRLQMLSRIREGLSSVLRTYSRRGKTNALDAGGGGIFSAVSIHGNNRS